MSKVVTGLIVVLGLWVGLEFFTQGPAHAFDGAFAGFFRDASSSRSTLQERDTRSTAQRAGDAVARSRAETEARRERMLGE